MTKPYSKLITIHTKNSSNLLYRIIHSLRSNIPTKSINVLIIDDSSDKKELLENLKTINKFAQHKITYVNRTLWNEIKRKVIKSSILKQKEIKLLKDIQLGKATWNTHNNRNVGLLVELLCFRDNKYSINFDDDMLINNIFKPNYPLVYLGGYFLSGCPDFSRLEWIQFYLRFLLKKYNIKNPLIPRYYVDKITRKLNISNCSQLIAMYTNLFISDSYKTDSLKEIIFPKREELSGGAYISHIENNMKSMFPDWYGEDWYWFNEIRNKEKPIKLYKHNITHASKQKDILNINLLKSEEVGKIITYFIRYHSNLTYSNTPIFKNYFLKQIQKIEYEILLINMLIPSVNDEEVNQLMKISKALHSLIYFLKKDLAIKDARYKVLTFKNKNRVWQGLTRKLCQRSENRYLFTQREVIK